MQFESATKGSIAMQIWLGKQYLGQRDNLDQRVNTELQIKADYSKLDDEELAELERLTNKAYARDDRCLAGCAACRGFRANQGGRSNSGGQSRSPGPGIV